MIDIEPDGSLNADNYINNELKNINKIQEPINYLNLKYTMAVNALKLIPTSFLILTHFDTKLKSGEDVLLYYYSSREI